MVTLKHAHFLQVSRVIHSRLYLNSSNSSRRFWCLGPTNENVGHHPATPKSDNIISNFWHPLAF